MSINGMLESITDTKTWEGINAVVNEDGTVICTIEAEPAPHGGVGV